MTLKKLLLSGLVLAAALVVRAQAPKYVFLFIGDGMSMPQRLIADEFSHKAGHGPLAMNDMPFQAMTRTSPANAIVTDSAAAATAIACGVKTNNGSSGVDAAGRPVRSCALAAKNAGKKVGIISNVTITHATPAGFYAHRRNRGDTYGIALDLVHSGFDFFAGGGLDTNEAASKKSPEYAAHGEPYAYAASQGYKLVDTKEAFLALKPSDGKILTRFTNGCLESAIDVTPEMNEPTLAELVGKAIEMLDGPEGFFVMTEGGRIDWSGHANDAATNLRDVLALDDAVKVALAFMEKHPDETLVIVTGDHETGGLSMGFAGAGYNLYMERLAHQTCSVGHFDGLIAEAFKRNPNLSLEDVKPMLRESFGFKYAGPGVDNADPMRLHTDEREEIRKAFEHDLAFHRSKIEENTKYDGVKRYLLGGVCRTIMAHKCGIAWSTGTHTAMPVLTTAKGCQAELFSGLMENSDLGKRLRSLYK